MDDVLFLFDLMPACTRYILTTVAQGAALPQKLCSLLNIHSLWQWHILHIYVDPKHELDVPCDLYVNHVKMALTYLNSIAKKSQSFQGNLNSIP